MVSDRPLPLSGIRVLDFGHIVAGPFCVRLLADLGADVVKIETAARQGRTGARRGGARSANTSGRTPHLAHINRNRRSIDLNLKSGPGLAVARRLTDVADVLVENFSTGVMDRLGLGYADVAKSNPRLIYASMSAFGHTGPRAGWTGMNVTLQACSGLMLATGAEGDPPIGISNSWNDYVGGLHAAVAILAALSKRAESGAGRHLDVSQFEASVAMLGSLVLAGAVTRKPPARPGSRSPSAAPQGCYRCAGDDEWCAISVQTAGQWQALLAELGESAQSFREPRFEWLACRIEHHDEIDRAIEAWTSARAPADVERHLQRCGVPAAAMRRGNVLADTEDWRQILLPIEGSSMRIVGPPFAFRGRTPVEPLAAPCLGADGREILRDWLNLDDLAIAGLLPRLPA